MSDSMHSANASDGAFQSTARPRRRWVVGLAFLAILIGYFVISDLTMSRTKVGDRAPDFTARTQSNELVSLSDFLGKKAVVLYFYPKNNTSVCTAQACSFRDAYDQFVDAGAEVIGVSSDSTESHGSFASEQRLQFQLISDRDGTLRKAFGVPKSLGLLPGRVTYVIDREGVVRLIFNSQLNADRHIAEALQMVRELSRKI